MSKMHFFKKFPQSHLTFDFSDLKLRDLAKLCSFQPIMTKLNYKKISYDAIFSDVIVITTPKNVIKITSQKFPSWAPSNQNFRLRQCFCFCCKGM